MFAPIHEKVAELDTFIYRIFDADYVETMRTSSSVFMKFTFDDVQI